MAVLVAVLVEVLVAVLVLQSPPLDLVKWQPPPLAPARAMVAVRAQAPELWAGPHQVRASAASPLW